jgi:hypothetical protein
MWATLNSGGNSVPWGVSKSNDVTRYRIYIRCCTDQLTGHVYVRKIMVLSRDGLQFCNSAGFSLMRAGIIIVLTSLFSRATNVFNKNFIFRWPCFSLQILANNQLEVHNYTKKCVKLVISKNLYLERAISTSVLSTGQRPYDHTAVKPGIKNNLIFTSAMKSPEAQNSSCEANRKVPIRYASRQKVAISSCQIK